MGDVRKSDFLLAMVVVLAIALLLASDVWLVQLQAQQNKDLQTVKSQLDQSKSGLVNFPVADYRLAVVFSIAALVIGAAGGFWLGRKTAKGGGRADADGVASRKKSRRSDA